MLVTSENQKVFETIETSESAPTCSDISSLSSPRFDLEGQVMPDLTTRKVAIQHVVNVVIHDLLVVAENPRSLATRAELFQLGQKLLGAVDVLVQIDNELESSGF